MFDPISSTEDAELYKEEFDEIFDVIVVGFGFGGAVAVSYTHLTLPTIYSV